MLKLPKPSVDNLKFYIDLFKQIAGPLLLWTYLPAYFFAPTNQLLYFYFYFVTGTFYSISMYCAYVGNFQTNLLWYFVTPIANLVVLPTLLFLDHNSLYLFIFHLTSLLIYVLIIPWYIALFVLLTFLATVPTALAAGFFDMPKWLKMYELIYIYTGIIFVAGIITFYTDRILTMQIVKARDIANIIGHEVNSPMASIEIYCSSLLRKIYSKPKKSITEPEEIAHYRKAEEYLVENILKIHNTSINLKFALNILINNMNIEQQTTLLESVSLKEFITRVLNEYAYAQYDPSILKVGEIADVTVLGDVHMLKFAMFNLIQNAFKATIHVQDPRIKIYSLYDKYTNKTYLIVEDNGTGIDSMHMKHIFDKFFTTNKSNGSGLGLYYCKEAMLRSRGNITCDSEKGYFTRFSLEFANV